MESLQFEYKITPVKTSSPGLKTTAYTINFELKSHGNNPGSLATPLSVPVSECKKSLQRNFTAAGFTAIKTP